MRKRNLDIINPGTSFKYDPIMLHLVFQKLGKASKLTSELCYLNIHPVLKSEAYQVLDAVEGYTFSDLLNDCLKSYLEKNKHLAIDQTNHTFSQIIETELSEWLNLNIH